LVLLLTPWFEGLSRAGSPFRVSANVKTPISMPTFYRAVLTLGLSADAARQP